MRFQSLAPETFGGKTCFVALDQKHRNAISRGCRQEHPSRTSTCPKCLEPCAFKPLEHTSRNSYDLRRSSRRFVRRSDTRSRPPNSHTEPWPPSSRLAHSVVPT